jgi:hypothetical protein
MNKIYLLSGSEYTDDLISSEFATDEAGLKRIAAKYLEGNPEDVTFEVDMFEETVTAVDADGDIIFTFHIYTAEAA